MSCNDLYFLIGKTLLPTVIVILDSEYGIPLYLSKIAFKLSIVTCLNIC